MTTDRTALESARDALPPLPDADTHPQRIEIWQAILEWKEAAKGVEAGFVANCVDYRIDDLLRDYAAQAVTAALSSPPVLRGDAVAWVDFTGQIKATQHGCKVLEANDYLYRAAPQASAPALDDARDAARWRFVRSPQISTSEHKALIEAISSDEGEHLDAAIDALMQQEPRS